MLKSLLLPYRFKRTGTMLLAIDLLCFALLIPLAKSHVGVETARTLTLLLEILFMAAFALIALSKERIEDEYVAALRSQTVTLVVYAFFLVQTQWAIAYYGSLAAGADGIASPCSGCTPFSTSSTTSCWPSSCT